MRLATLLAAVLAVAPGIGGPAPDAGAPAGAISIECGGYDADGDVAVPAAVEIGTLTLAPGDAIPAVCGGYTADGTFIGDD